MKYNPKVIMIALAIAIVLVLVIGAITQSQKQSHGAVVPAPDSSLQSDSESSDPISDCTESQELPIPPITPKDPATPAGPEQADVEFHISDHRPDMSPSAGTGEVEYDTKEVERNA